MRCVFCEGEFFCYVRMYPERVRWNQKGTNIFRVGRKSFTKYPNIVPICKECRKKISSWGGSHAETN